MSKTPNVVNRWLLRAEQFVSIYTILAGLTGFGIGACFFGPIKGLYLAIGLFGAVGALDIFHRQITSHLQQRRNLNDPLTRSHLYLGMSDKYKDWRPTVLKEFSHNGIHFRSFGFEQYRVPLLVSQPLCPECKGVLLERTCVKFPARTRIQFRCPCGFSRNSTVTLNELQAEAEHLCNTPKNTAREIPALSINRSLGIPELQDGHA
jgi:hypothetical protein